MNNKFWDVFVWLIKNKENKHKKNRSNVNQNFYLFTYVILVYLLIKDIFIFTCSNKLKIIHISLFIFSKFFFKVGYIKWLVNIHVFYIFSLFSIFSKLHRFLIFTVGYIWYCCLVYFTDNIGPALFRPPLVEMLFIISCVHWK